MSTELCKTAIVDFLKQRPGHVAAQFVDTEGKSVEEFESDALQPKNWRRMSKTGSGQVIREFDCKPYDDQLRARVVTDQDQITLVEVFGE